MFNLRVYLTNICLASFDMAVTTACYTAVQGVTEGAAAPLLTAILWVVLSSYFGMYRSRRLDSPLADFRTIFKVVPATWVAAHLVPSFFPTPGPTLTARFLLANALVLLAARSAVRLTLRELRRRGHNVKQLVLVASQELADRLEMKINQRSHYGYRVVSRLIYSDDAESLLNQARDILRTRRIDDVIVALPAQANALCAALIAECESHGINVRIVPDLFPILRADTQIQDLDGIPLINARLYPTEYLGYILVKRAFDLCVSLLVLILLSPLFLCLAVLVKLTSRGPVFFMQDRVGMNGKEFRIIKFRTMRQTPSLDPDSHWTVANDRHITPAGRWLRRTNLDELPQFFNVLKGDMSIVGPRPERPFFLERFRREVPEYMARHYVKCGITGWAQVNGWRGDTPIPPRVAHDLYYIRHWRVSFDIKILLLTVARTFFPGSAPSKGVGMES